MQVKTDRRDDLIAQLIGENCKLRALLQRVCAHPCVVLANDDIQMQAVCADCNAKLPHPANTNE